MVFRLLPNHGDLRVQRFFNEPDFPRARRTRGTFRHRLSLLPSCTSTTINTHLIVVSILPPATNLPPSSRLPTLLSSQICGAFGLGWCYLTCTILGDGLYSYLGDLLSCAIGTVVYLVVINVLKGKRRKQRTQIQAQLPNAASGENAPRLPGSFVKEPGTTVALVPQKPAQVRGVVRGLIRSRK